MQIISNHKPSYQELLKWARKEQGLTLKQVAKRYGATEAEISHLELGKRTPNIDKLEKWANAVGMQVKIEFVSINTSALCSPSS